MQDGKNTRLGSDFWTRDRLCGAKTKNGGHCQKPKMKGKNRCRLHGGLSTGPRTKEGMDRMRRSKTKHGRFAGPDHPDLKGHGKLWRHRPLSTWTILQMARSVCRVGEAQREFIRKLKTKGESFDDAIAEAEAVLARETRWLNRFN